MFINYSLVNYFLLSIWSSISFKILSITLKNGGEDVLVKIKHFQHHKIHWNNFIISILLQIITVNVIMIDGKYIYANFRTFFFSLIICRVQRWNRFLIIERTCLTLSFVKTYAFSNGVGLWWFLFQRCGIHNEFSKNSDKNYRGYACS